MLHETSSLLKPENTSHKGVGPEIVGGGEGGPLLHKEKVKVSLQLMPRCLKPVVTWLRANTPPAICMDRICISQVFWRRPGTLGVLTFKTGGSGPLPGHCSQHQKPCSASPPSPLPHTLPNLCSSRAQTQWVFCFLSHRISRVTPSATCQPTCTCLWWWQSLCCLASPINPPSSLKVPRSL